MKKGYAFLWTAGICFLAGLSMLLSLHLLGAILYFSLGLVAVWIAMGGRVWGSKGGPRA